MWNLEKDAFTFEMILPEKPYTDRGVLAILNSIYDPLGFGIPVTLQGRLLIIPEWRTKHETRWDDPLPQRL